MAVFILTIIICGLIWYCWYLKSHQATIISINDERQKQIEQETNRLNEIQKAVDNQSNTLKDLQQTADLIQSNIDSQLQNYYELKNEELGVEYEEKKQILHEKLQILQSELDSLKSKQLAYIQAQQREVEMTEKKDYYRLQLSDVDLNDVQLLRQVQAQIRKPEAIDKIIWELYYKPAYDVLMSRLFQSANKTVCGIYKITCIETNQAYIGQSLDIRQRFRTHIKTALSSNTATNKLYQAMKAHGVHNFTFEILEVVSREQLNEREKYWIDFYKTKEFGLNKTVGG